MKKTYHLGVLSQVDDTTYHYRAYTQ